MNDAGRLAGFGVALAAALGLGFGLGTLVGPFDTSPAPEVVHESSSSAADGHPAMEMETRR